MRSDVNELITVIYLVSWIFLGNFMLLNLFLAILLDSFVEEDELENEGQKTPDQVAEEKLINDKKLALMQGEELVIYFQNMTNTSAKNKKGGFVKEKKVKQNNNV